MAVELEILHTDSKNAVMGGGVLQLKVKVYST